MRDMIISKQLHNESNSPFDTIFTEKERIELAARSLTSLFISDTLKTFMKDNPELERVLFEVVYPQFGFRQKIENDRQATRPDEGWSCLVQ
jgi:hypothetical protein